MAEATEKITINVGVVDLGKIDVLVEQGFYANRTDFIKDSIRRNLDVHEEDVRRALDRAHAESEANGGSGTSPGFSVNGGLGILGFSRRDLERLKSNNKKMRIVCAGLVVFSSDVTPELIDETVDTFKVFGTVRASEAVREALKKKAPRAQV